MLAKTLVKQCGIYNIFILHHETPYTFPKGIHRGSSWPRRPVEHVDCDVPASATSTARIGDRPQNEAWKIYKDKAGQLPLIQMFEVPAKTHYTSRWYYTQFQVVCSAGTAFHSVLCAQALARRGCVWKPRARACAYTAHKLGLRV